MSHPIFLHLHANGDLWASNDLAFTPGATSSSGQKSGNTEASASIAIWKINSDAAPQKITTLSGTVGSNLSATGATGKNGKEVT